MPDKVKLELFTPVSFCTADGLKVLADALEADASLSVTHWGIEERGLAEFDRKEFVKKVDGSNPGIRIPSLARRKGLKWKGHFSADQSPAQGLSIEFGEITDPGQLEPVFRFGSTLAAHLRPVFGFVHPVFLGKGQEYNVAGRLDSREFREFGPRSLCARTFFDRGLVELIGKERLEACNLPMREIDGDVLEIDLCPEPWTATITKLNKARKSAMATLAESGIFGDYAKNPFYKPGPNWKGVPDAGRP